MEPVSETSVLHCFWGLYQTSFVMQSQDLQTFLQGFILF